MKRFYKPSTITQKQINTMWTLDTTGKMTESAVCPFCGTLNQGEHQDNVKAGYIKSIKSCRHFVDFVMGANNKISVFFEGQSVDLEGV